MKEQHGSYSLISTLNRLHRMSCEKVTVHEQEGKRINPEQAGRLHYIRNSRFIDNIRKSG